MRFSLILLAALLLPTSAATWGSEVQTDEGKVFVLVYSRGALASVMSRGAHEELLQALCDEGAFMVREIDGTTASVHPCNRE